MQVAWRRSALPAPPADDAGDPLLIEQLRDEIASNGPISFARFMEVALYSPGRGYYATSTARPTRAGDFLTAPEMHPIFGWVLARRVDALWRQLGEPRPFTLREYGAGTGALIVALLDGLRRTNSGLLDCIRYQPVDLGAQVSGIQQRLSAAGMGELLDSSASGPFVGAVIANEYVDALPVRRVIKLEGRLHELKVGWENDRFVDVPTEIEDDRLTAWFSEADVALGDGQIAEVNLAMLDWLRTLATDLERGAALVLDYGAGATDLHGGSRPTGTLRAFRGQHVSSDVLSGVGHQDITAHVDFDALERGARRSGLAVLDRSRQAEFLLANGLEEAYAEARTEADQEWSAALTLRSAVGRLLDTGGLGGYTVVTLARGI